MTPEQKIELTKALTNFIRNITMNDKVTVDFPSLGQLGDRLRRAMIAHFAWEIDSLNPPPPAEPPTPPAPPAESPTESPAEPPAPTDGCDNPNRQ